LAILWNWEAATGTGDHYDASFRGSKSRVEIRQGKPEHYIPELYVTPASTSVQADVFSALQRKVAALQAEYPGIAVQESSPEARLVIPERFRVGHEAHFAQVTNKFSGYLKAPQTMPAWEKPNMLVKYFISTKGAEAGGDDK